MKFKKPEERPSSGSTNELYIRIKDGGEVVFIPRGEIYEFYSKFGVKGEVPPDTEGARLKYKINAVVYEGGAFKAKIYEFGKSVYEQFYEISQVCDVTKTKLRLSRKGSSKEDTTYFLLPVMKEPLSAGQLGAIDQVELNILDKPAAGQRLAPSSNQEEESWRGF